MPAIRDDLIELVFLIDTGPNRGEVACVRCAASDLGGSLYHVELSNGVNLLMDETELLVIRNRYEYDHI